MRVGAERIAEHAEQFAGRRVGLVTNHTGRAAIETLRASFELVALFSPEHGLAGNAREGEPVASGVDAASGLRVHSLYGATTRPTREMLAGVDVLAYDIQDVAARCYTYASTLAEVMRAAAAAHLPVVVLDRPDPLGALAPDGPLLDMRFASFVGASPVPLRYAMTPGELAAFYVDALGIACELHVVPLEGWRRQWLDETAVPFVPPSPALRTLEACALYAGTVLFEGTNVSEGRGTDAPFMRIDAPWLDAAAVARAVDVSSYGARLAPDRSVVRISIADRPRLRPVALAVALLTAIRARHRELAFDAARFDRLAGSDALRLALERGGGADDIVASWDGPLAEFGRRRLRYVRYERSRA